MKYLIPLCMAAMLVSAPAAAQTMMDETPSAADTQMDCPAIPSYATLDTDDDDRVSKEEFDVLADDTENASLFSNIDTDRSAGISEEELENYREVRGCP